MKTGIQKSMALLLAAVIVLTTVLPSDVYAYEATEAKEGTISQNEMQDEAPAGISQNAVTQEDIEEVPETEEPGESEETGKINFLYLESPRLQTPDTQNVLIGFGDGTRAIVKGILTVENYETKEQIFFEDKAILEDSVLFSMDYTPQDAGIYEAVAAEFTMDDGSTESVCFSDTGMENVYFGVDRDFSISPEEEEIQNPVLDMQIVSLDENSASSSAIAQITNAVEEALQGPSQDLNGAVTEDGTAFGLINQSVAASGSSGSKGGNLVVVLDPGHDDTHAGARANGLKEEELTLKVAQYCKEELEKYSGVTVYMTRSSGACPFPGTTSTDDNSNRVTYAQSVGADVYVSIHFNSATVSGAQGAEVFYPNSHYNAGIGSQGAGLANEIENKLVALGLVNRGISIRNSEDRTTYPDGSPADYYGVIRRSKLSGFPAIIIEHAFLTNAGDAAFLKSEENLKKLGIADAQGIVNYYGLTQEEADTGEITTGKLSFEAVNNLKGTFTLRLSGVSAKKGIKKIDIRVWSKSDKSNLKTYTATKQSDGSYTVKVKLSSHGYQYGKYTAEAVITDKKNKTASIKKSKKISDPTPAVSVSANSAKTKYAFEISNVACTNGVKSVKIAVWSKTGGKDDLIWYNASKKSIGVYSASVKIAKHKTAGKYTAEVYVVDKKGNQKKIATKTFKVEGPSAGKLVFEEIDSAKGTFKIRLKGVSSPSGISSVKFTVWSEKDKNNAKTYTAKKMSDGSYLATVKISKHKNKYGKYRVEAFVVDKNKIEVKKSGSKTINSPVASITAVGNAKETQYTLTAAGVTFSEGIKSVKFAVWSKINGKDDLKWYKAKKSGTKWTAKVKISNHKDIGAYGTEIYVVDKKGKEHKLGEASFAVGLTANLYEIMGTTTVTAEQMAAYYNAVTKYPGYYAGTEAPTITKFCQIYINECKAEGVKAEVAFVQAMKETNFLRYGGDVDISQFNFAGLGAVGGGAKGAEFATVTLGIRAQIQHLKAYASDEPLKKACVDTRFENVSRCSAPYVQWLGIKENPYGKGWATDPGYGYDIITRISKLMTY